MIRRIVNYVESLKCYHDWDKRRVRVVDEFDDYLYLMEFWTCQKCGCTKKIKYK